jgi:hypothetical protein
MHKSGVVVRREYKKSDFPPARIFEAMYEHAESIVTFGVVARFPTDIHQDLGSLLLGQNLR